MGDGVIGVGVFPFYDICKVLSGLSLRTWVYYMAEKYLKFIIFLIIEKWYYR